MAHLHEMRDSDNHFVIDPITMEIINNSAKHTLQQGDHNSEIYTFELPKVIEGHDMTQCNLVQVHYTNTGSDRTSKSEDVHKITDMAVSEDDPNTLVCSWTIHGNATKYAGTLSFRIRFACIESDGTYSYKKHTGTYKDITISAGDDNAKSIEEDHSDALADIENRIAAMGSGGSAIILSPSYETGTSNSAEILAGIIDGCYFYYKDIDYGTLALQSCTADCAVFAGTRLVDGQYIDVKVLIDSAGIASKMLESPITASVENNILTIRKITKITR